MSGYSGLFNQSSIVADVGSISDHTVDSSLDLTGASVTGFPVNTTQFAFLPDGSGRNVLSLNNLAITTAMIQDMAVTTPKIADLAVTTIKLADSSVTTVKIADSNVTDIKIVSLTGTKITGLSDGQVIIGKTGNFPVFASLTGTTNQITITNGSGSITLSLPQNIATTSSPTFASETLTNTTNQLVLGTTNTTTINSVAPSASRVHSLNDPGTNSSFVMTDGLQRLNGIKEFTSPSKWLNSSYVQIGDFGLATNAITGLLIYPVPSSSISVSLDFHASISRAIAFPDSGFSSDLIALSNYGNIFSVTNTFNGTTNLNSTINAAGSIVSTNTNTFTGLNSFTLTPITMEGDTSSGVNAKQLILRGHTTTSKQLQIGFNSSTNFCTLQGQNTTGPVNIPILINPLGGNVSVNKSTNNFGLDISGTMSNTSVGFINNSNGYTSPSNNNNGAFFIYGSGTSSTNSDILHIRENTNTNPKEVWIGYDTSTNVGVIQSVSNNVAYTDLYLCPNTSCAVAVNGLKVPRNNLTGTYEIFDTLEKNYSTTWTCSGALAITTNVYFTKIENQVFVSWDDITGTIASSTTINFAGGTITPRFRPVRRHRAVVYGNNSGASVSSCTIFFNTDGSLTMYNTNGSNFTSGAFGGIYGSDTCYAYS